MEVRVIYGHDGDDTFGPDSWWAYWHDNPEDDEAYRLISDECHHPIPEGTEMQESLDEHLHGNCWTNRVRYFFERNGGTEP